MEDFKTYSLKPGGVMILNSSMLYLNCPYCEKTSDVERRPGVEQNPEHHHVEFHIQQPCPLCHFIIELDLSYIENEYGMYVTSHYTNQVITSIDEGKTLTFYHKHNLDKGHYAIWTDFLLNKLIISNADALLHSKHESKKVRDYCWAFLKSDKERKCI
jgi:hypothetical protein